METFFNRRLVLLGETSRKSQERRTTDHLKAHLQGDLIDSRVKGKAFQAQTQWIVTTVDLGAHGSMGTLFLLNGNRRLWPKGAHPIPKRR